MPWREIIIDRYGRDPAWDAAIDAFARAPVLDLQKEALAGACSSPEDLRLLADIFRDTPREPEPPTERARLFLSLVDESPASLAEWVSGLQVLFSWLRRAGRGTSFGMALGYLQCCSDALGSGANFTTLPDAVQDMLHEHGFDG
ncbi:MAG: hypothetical protein ACLFR7_07005 [Opitutales bacterium]